MKQNGIEPDQLASLHASRLRRTGASLDHLNVRNCRRPDVIGKRLHGSVLIG
jgi:hypothetical protein